MMVDPRIYRAGWVIVLVALIVFGFSVQNRPGAASTTLPPGVSFGAAEAQAEGFAARYGGVHPGSPRDDRYAATVASDLAGTGFSVSTHSEPLRTVGGISAVTTVEATRPGLGQGSIVVVADRDLAQGRPGSRGALAGTAATAVLIQLAHELSGATLNRSITLVSTAGSVGAAGESRLAAGLRGAEVDAVIVLGDLAAARPHGPVVVPWSQSARIAPVALSATLSQYVSAQAAIRAGSGDLGAQLAQLAFPFATGGQAPFLQAGIPAVELSLSGDRLPSTAEAVDPQRIPALGLAVAQTVAALDAGPAVGPPGSFLSLGSKLVPPWAIRLLVLALIAPVAVTLVDAVARVLRRGHSVLSWAVWVLSGIAPWVVALVLLKLAGLLHILAALPAGVGAQAPFPLAALAVVVVTALATAVAFRLLRPLGVQIASGIGWRRTPTSPAGEGASVALSVVFCGLCLLLWLINPLAAALLVPALHLWLWIGSIRTAGKGGPALALLLAGLIVPALVALYLLLDLGLTPWGLLWSLGLGIAGPALGVGTGLACCVVLGIFTGHVVLIIRASRATGLTAPSAVSVRGPGSYAGPGSLGGTESALRR